MATTPTPACTSSIGCRGGYGSPRAGSPRAGRRVSFSSAHTIPRGAPPRGPPPRVAGRRFQQEARAMSRLRHPNNLAVLDFGQAADGRLYMVTEMLRGRTLDVILREEAPLAPRRAVKLLAQALAALAEAHAAGIVH